MDTALQRAAKTLAETLTAHDLTVTTAESCTGGWVAKVITDIAGSSAWFERGFVTYSNDAKQQLIGVDGATLDAHGAVSEPVVAQMARGAQYAAGATYAISVSGIAGPDGGSAEKPVGTVWFGFAGPGETVVTRHKVFAGNREAVRRQATAFALTTLWQHFLQKT